MCGGEKWLRVKMVTLMWIGRAAGCNPQGGNHLQPLLPAATSVVVSVGFAASPSPASAAALRAAATPVLPTATIAV